MTTDMIALGRRAAACREWRWMSGMLMILDPSLPWDQRRVMRYSEDVRAALGDDRLSPRAWADGTAPVPDLHDPATLGCILALVRRVYAHEGDAYTYPASGGWHVIVRGRVVATGDIEAEALVAALEGAP